MERGAWMAIVHEVVKESLYNLANKQHNMFWLQSGHHVVNFFLQVGIPVPTDISQCVLEQCL